MECQSELTKLTRYRLVADKSEPISAFSTVLEAFSDTDIGI